ncbi:hypothetical protein [Corynebacterium epidermidicanis]|uniref:Uncharacterized protein n=1 Tax=Corynebacterium epidermidicanis TaxID=1050174 RepID=A0A0G3GLY3_9CORY|nr:hypothetical protein [Corynebacterium epidermidicanis]AKK02124.1 hypothetical protein CEPID_01185 [Corynebacterium epidermidicanis]
MIEHPMTVAKSHAWLIPATMASVAVVASLGLGTMGAMTASVTNDANTAGAGKLVMQEAGMEPGSVSCTSSDDSSNSAVCSSMNKYGGNLQMTPGLTEITTFKLSNIGSVAASSFTLTAGQCESVPVTSDMCNHMNIAIMDEGHQVFAGTAAELSNQAFTLAAPVKPGEGRAFTISTTLSKDVPNSAQGGSIKQPLTWTFTA